MSNSSLVSYTQISPNKTSPRNHVIDTITIHCMAGNLSIETCGNVFATTSRKARKIKHFIRKVFYFYNT